ncbi:DNL zinc finger-domain-containing protein [Auriculariales sp. MPI-PUGE-AT-0066]|nr:DNL zinc finger-domain-containing protein [Auriculariales sp. MPI-PUGE-AT-0066]
MFALFRPTPRTALHALPRATLVSSQVLSRRLAPLACVVRVRLNSTAAPPAASPRAAATQQPTVPSENNTEASRSQEAQLSMTFTCGVSECGHRSSHVFTKRAYTTGIVIVECPSCKNRHLIADHKGWFKETDGTGGGSLKTVEDLLRAKGEHVDRGRIDVENGTIEYFDESESPAGSEPKQ